MIFLAQIYDWLSGITCCQRLAQTTLPPQIGELKTYDKDEILGRGLSPLGIYVSHREEQRMLSSVVKNC